MTYGNTASGFEVIEDFGELFGEAAQDGGLESAEADWEGLLGSRRRRRRIRQQLDGATEAAETFTTSGTAAISTLELRSAVAASTETEFRRWNTAAHILEEGHDWGKHILKDDYWPAAGIANATTHFGGTWWSAQAWSAAFVMFCVARARTQLVLPNALLGHPTASNNTAHSAYVWQAHRDRNNRVRQRYWAFLPAQQPLEVGDIVVRARGTTTPQSARTAMEAATYDSYTSHGDIVTRITGNDVRVVGGNVTLPGAVGADPPGLTVGARGLRIDAHGFLDTAHASANNVFVILKPMGISFRGSLRGMVL